ncbi:YqaA family protein [Limibacterium fermenti]|uniref:YqaA family protein n=1 Tax=Limibacterium fermenti TaxID=3229863 RepID=UPI000E82F940|nr:hypothetical protein [Porphyromonadaceae bacterium]HBK30393.1 hypothetical protein [Porphyromonadaceae bacterium]HBX46937.1 hypothetical protein [Porphyromonadaceae bacterium]
MLDFLAEYGYWGLFLASFLAATVVPLSSEVVFTGLLSAGLDTWMCIAFATIGNTLGGATSYWIGSLGKTEWMRKYFGVREEQIEKMQHRLKGKGALMGFFGFLPIVGEAIIIALGFMRANPWVVVSSMLAGKFLRYVVLGLGVEQVIKMWF